MNTISLKSLAPMGLGLCLSVTLIHCGTRSGLSTAFDAAAESEITNLRIIESTESFPESQKHSVSSPRLVWISIDGLKSETLRGFLDRQKESQLNLQGLHPFGIKHLLKVQQQRARVQIADPTITASSHASTMTCSPAGVHGVLSNMQWNGRTDVSGFEKAYTTETFVQALRTSGRRVGVVGYPGFDSRTKNRSADVTVSYASTQESPQLIPLALPKNQGTLDSPASRETNAKDQANLEVAIGRRSTQTPADLKVKVILNRSGAPEAELVFQSQDSIELKGRVSSSTWTKIIYNKGNETWAATLRLFRDPSRQSSPENLWLYVSPTFNNEVTPQSFREQLDRENFVFAYGKDHKLAKQFGPGAFIASMDQRLRYFAGAAHAMLDQSDLDAAFLYFEDIDVLGHTFEGDPKAREFVDEHLRKFDHVLGSLLERMSPNSNVLITGDHGMSAITYELNVLELIPKEIRNSFHIQTSGGSLFIYGRSPESLREAPPQTPDFQKLVEMLRSAHLPGHPDEKIFTQVIVKGSPESLAKGWMPSTDLPWVHATAHIEIGLLTSVEPQLLMSLRRGVAVSPGLQALVERSTQMNGRLLPEPSAPGQHGHASDDPSMMTSLFAWGPEFSSAKDLGGGQRKTVSNLNLVPIVGRTLNWAVPSHCQ